MLLHTNDLHSHLEGHGPELDYSPLTPNDDATRGGFARIAAKIAADRTAAATAHESVILADAGDFMMGTGFSSFLGIAKGTELYELSALGYDAIALGNHEFDFTSEGLAGAIHAAVARGATPKLVASNMTVPSAAAGLSAIVGAGLIPAKRITTLPNGLKVGFVGIMGKNASDVAPLAAPVTFAPAASVQATVDDLRNNDHVDLVIALSHSGTDAEGNGEDRVLAQQAHGIDIIVSGHTHIALPAPVAVPNADGKTTYIVQTGAHGLNLGRMEFSYTPGSGVSVASYALEPIDDRITGDAAVQARVDGYVSDIDQTFAAAGAPFRYFGAVAGTAFDLPNTAFEETALGDLVTDSYLAAANALPGPHADLAIEASGNIRVPLLKGKTGRLAFSDVFNVVPLGLGPDHEPGYPLAAVYLTAKDIVSGLTLSTIAADPNSSALGLHDNDYFLQISGLTYKTNPTAPLFGHVTHAEIGNTVVFDRATMPPDDTKCYRVVMTYYVASLLGLLETASGGALTATPKQADCSTAYTAATLPTAILDAGGGAEIKQWQALVKYIARAPMIPAGYAEPAGRIIAAP